MTLQSTSTLVHEMSKPCPGGWGTRASDNTTPRAEFHENSDTEALSHDSRGPDDHLLHLQWTGDQADERKRMMAALRGAGDAQTADRMAACGAVFTTYASADGHAKVSPHRCDLSVCPRCIGHRTRAIRARYTHHAHRTKESRRPWSTVLDGGRWVSARAYGELLAADSVRPFPGDTLPRETGHPVKLKVGTETREPGVVRMMTLTQPVKGDETWKQSRARLLRQWARFWRNKDTRARVDGGMRRIETTWSGRHQGWHVHIHFAYEGDYWNHPELVSRWMASGEGSNVDIRDVTAPAELFKYLLKTAKAPAPRLVEYAHQSKGVRNLEMIGAWREAIPEPEPKETTDFFKVDAGAIRGAAEYGHVEPWRLDQWRRILGPDSDPLRWAKKVWVSRRQAIHQREERETKRIMGEIRRSAERMERRRTKARRKTWTARQATA